MMRLVCGLLLAAVSTAAVAADLAPITKAPKPRVLLTYMGSGTYFGLGTFMEADRSVLTSQNGTDVTAYTAGGSVFGVAGYMWGDGTTWKAVEVMASYQNLGGPMANSPLAVSNMNSSVGFTERFMIGGPIAGLLSMLPNLSTVFPTLPVPPLGASNVHPYLFAAVHEDQIGLDYNLQAAKVWRVRAGLGAGVQSVMGTAGNAPGASPVTLDIWAEYLIPGTGITVGAPSDGTLATANLGGGARVGSSLKY